MSFAESIRVCFKKYATFEGRARRSEYWWFALFTGIIFIVTEVLDAAAGTPIFVILALVALLLPSIAVAVRRLHDTTRSGVWYFISLVPLIGGIILLVFLATDSTPGSNQYGAQDGAGQYDAQQYPAQQQYPGQQ